MDARIDVDDEKITQALARLRTLSRGNAAPAMREIGRVLKTSTQFRFRDQRGPNNSPWHKVRRGGQALRLTGRLRDSIEYVVARNEVSVGTNVVYAKTHQFGINDEQTVKSHIRVVEKAFGKKLKFGVNATVKQHTRRMRIWARPFLGFSDNDKEDILDILSEHIQRLATRG